MIEGVVYFIKPVAFSGPIKIGFSTRPKLRLAQLMEWSPVPLEIIAATPGTLIDERCAHNHFADLHSHREWFHAGARLLSAIEAIKNGAALSEAVDLGRSNGSLHALKIRMAQSLRGTSQETEAL